MRLDRLRLRNFRCFEVAVRSLTIHGCARMPLTFLTPARGLLFRITHAKNLGWTLANGLHCANSSHRDPNFVQIGNPDLISARKSRQVPLDPFGTLADYVPFYFTPKSVMLYNILTGHNGMKSQEKNDILILVTDIATVYKLQRRLLFTDRHAYMKPAHWFDDRSELARRIDWHILQNHDFKNADRYPDKKDRYQAEALVHRHLPETALIEIACASPAQKQVIEGEIQSRGMTLPVRVCPEWYF